MILQYIVCDVELPNSGKFSYTEFFPYPGFLQVFLQDLIIGIPYPGKYLYSFKYPIRKSAYLFEINHK